MTVELDYTDYRKPRICCLACGKSEPIPALSVAMLSRQVRDFQFTHAKCKGVSHE